VVNASQATIAKQDRQVFTKEWI